MAVASIVLTTALIFITGYYAWQTKKTVDELKAARGANILPKVAFLLEHPGGLIGVPTLTNSGVGPALDVEVTMAWMPGGPAVPWSASLLAPAERVRFGIPKEVFNMTALTEKYKSVEVNGTCKDALGQRHVICQSFDIGRNWELGIAAGQWYHRDDLKEIAQELEKIRRVTETISRPR